MVPGGGITVTGCRILFPRTQMENYISLKTLQTISILAIFLTAISLPVSAQQENKALRDGSKLYKKGQYDKALPEFQKAVQQNPKNPVANYNLGNTQFRSNDFVSAETAF